jgi:hypothetical protein
VKCSCCQVNVDVVFKDVTGDACPPRSNYNVAIGTSKMDMPAIKCSVGSEDKLILCIICSNCHLFNMFKNTSAIANAISLCAHLSSLLSFG